MSMIKTLAAALSVTATATGDWIQLNETPFMGGGGREDGTDGRNAILAVTPIGGAGVVLLEGHAGPDAPASNTTDAYTVATLNAASPARQEILLPRWIRTRVSVIGTGTTRIALEGVQ